MVYRLSQIHLLHPNTMGHSQQQVAGGIGFYVNANKGEFMSFKEVRDASTSSGEPLNFTRALHMPRQQ